MSVLRHSAAELLAQLNAGQVTSVELTEACLDQIRKYDSQVKAFLRVEPDRAPQSREHRLRLRNSLKPRMGNRNAMSDSGRAEALTAKHCRKNGTATQPSLVAEPGSQSDERRPLVVGRQAQHDILLSKESDDVRPIRRGLAEALSGERFRIVNCAEVEKVACARPGCETGIRVATASVIEIPD